MKQFHTIYLFLLLTIAVISAEGCSLVGYGIGSLIRSNSHDTTEVFNKPLFRDVNDNTGRFARIQYDDTTVRYATFNGYTNESDTSYHARCASFIDKHSNSFLMPFKIGNWVDITEDNVIHQSGRFKAYTPEGLDIELTNNEQSTHLPYSRLTYAGVSGQWNSLAATQSALDANAVPVKAILHFTGNQTQFTATNSDFYNATFIENNSGKWVGLAIGAVIDIAVIVFAAAWSIGGLGSGFNPGLNH
jgi:hypothetical protein